jgi:hypothetical protein
MWRDGSALHMLDLFRAGEEVTMYEPAERMIGPETFQDASSIVALIGG